MADRTDTAAPSGKPLPTHCAADGWAVAELYAAESPVDLRSTSGPARTAAPADPAPPPAAAATQVSEPYTRGASPGVAQDQSGYRRPDAASTAPHDPSSRGSRYPSVRELGAQRRRKATWGWRARFGLSAGAGEALHARAVAAAQASFPAPRLVMVANPKGGAGKTPTTLILAATLAQLRTESTVAWDINETRCTIGLRAAVASPNTTVLTVLQHGPWLARPDAAAADLTGMLRRQADGSLVLASSEDPTVMAQIGAEHVRFVRYLLEQRFGVLVVDTGNNTAAPGFVATAEQADVLVIPTGPFADHIGVVWQLLDGLAARPQTAHLVDSAVVVVTSPTGAPLPAPCLAELTNVLGRVLAVPADPAIACGDRLPYAQLSTASRRAWTQVAAAVADVAALASVNDTTPRYALEPAATTDPLDQPDPERSST